MSVKDNPIPRLADGRIPSLDGLRALAIAGVLASKAAHTPGFPETHWLRARVRSGNRGGRSVLRDQRVSDYDAVDRRAGQNGTVSLTGSINGARCEICRRSRPAVGIVRALRCKSGSHGHRSTG